MFSYLEIESGQTGNGPALLPSICMAWKYFRHLRIIYSRIMKPTGTSAILALLGLLVAAANAYPSCGCDFTSHEPSAISSGAEIVTYGEPCFCKESLPYSVEIPKTPPPAPVESLKSYGYSVITPSQPGHNCLKLPVKIQTPVIEERPCDCLSGKSYGVTVQHQKYSPGPRRYSFDCAVQKPVRVQAPAYRPSMSISIQHGEEVSAPRFGPLPFAVETPLYREPKPVPRLTGLTTTVDRVLVPACEINGCPDCSDVIPKKRFEPPYIPC